MQSTIRRFKSSLKPVMAGVCIALLLGIVFAAAIAPLHKSLHSACHHEQEQEQECVVCAFVHGKVDAMVFAIVTPARVELATFCSPLNHPPVLPAVDFLLLPERAPPVLS